MQVDAGLSICKSLKLQTSALATRHDSIWGKLCRMTSFDAHQAPAMTLFCRRLNGLQIAA
jgi:hypothetical protein